MISRRTVYLLLVLLGILLVYPAVAYDLPKWFPFNDSQALDEWQEKVFKGKVLYEVRAEPGQGYLSAHSLSTSSGLLYRVKFDVHKFPMCSWEWMVKTFPADEKIVSSSGWIERDDYAARVYVIFTSWIFTKITTLEYIWDENYATGTILSSPYSDNIKLFVIESGPHNVNSWVFEERNIFEDYQKAFGRTPPRYAGAVAIMTDADNSVSTAEALYKNLRIGYDNDSIEK